MNVSPGSKMDPKLRELIEEKGWSGPVDFYSVDPCNSTLDKSWNKRMFSRMLRGQYQQVGVFYIEPGTWVPGSIRFYVQVAADG